MFDLPLQEVGLVPGNPTQVSLLPIQGQALAATSRLRHAYSTPDLKQESPNKSCSILPSDLLGMLHQS